MNITDPPTERASALTDVLVAVLAIICAIRLVRIGASDRQRSGIWSAVFWLLAFSALLGAVSHGIEMPPAVNELLWQPLFLGLGLTVALFAVGMLHDLWGARASRRALPVFLALGVGFYLVRLILAGSFLFFIVFEGVVMVLSFVACSILALRGRLPGAGLMLVGIVLTILAAMAQAVDTVAVPVIWLDHNGVFHVIQLAAILYLVAGIGRGLQTPARSVGDKPPQR